MKMDLQQVISAALLFLVLWVQSCASRQNKVFIPKHHCGFGVLCNSTTFYPEEEIKRIVDRNRKRLVAPFGSVIEPAENQLVLLTRNSAEEYEEKNMCKTKIVTVMPKTGFDVNMKLRYIVNVEGFEQVLKYETCVETGNDCFAKDLLPNDFSTFCKQTYSIVRLLLINNQGKIEYGRFTVPSNCVCSYRRDNTYFF